MDLGNKLNLGCGHQIKEDWINHDILPLPGVNVVYDLRIFPWPFEDQQFEEIYADNVLEHLPDTIKTLEEIYRISKPGATIFIGVPFWNSYEAWGDPTHVKFFSEEIFEFFDPRTWRGSERSYYSIAKFNIEHIDYVINPFKPIFSNSKYYRYSKKIRNRFIKKIIKFFATYFSNIIHGLDIYLVRQ